MISRVPSFIPVLSESNFLEELSKRERLRKNLIKNSFFPKFSIKI
jgi:hypothetical protein